MKYFVNCIILFFALTGQAQIDKPLTSSSVIIDNRGDLSTDSYKLSPGLTAPVNNFTMHSGKLKDSTPFNRTEKSFYMSNDNGLLKPTAESTPRYFEKDKKIKEAYKSDQYLGDFKSEAVFVELVYRDHESVDGDVVRIFVNDDIVRPNVLLDATFRGFKIDLIKGFNRIDIQALNQGASGPNTAAFKLFDDTGKLITSNEWNLTTGVKATLIVVKE
ncbi:hypothetical protein GCM10022393_38920 [Aquimarina addita]|uniref:Secreted protein n=1 Tax=Aquimarina addita TaxID=870485 RepID=A0ABP6UWJ3_9FLAO